MKKENLNNIFIVFLAFSFIIQIWLFKGLIRSELIIGLLFIFMFFLNKNKLSIYIIILSLSPAVVTSLFTLVHGFNDTSIFITSIKISFCFILTYVISFFLSKNKNSLLVSLRISVTFLFFYYIGALFDTTLQDIAIAFKGRTYGIEERMEVYRLWFPTSGHTFHLGVFFTIIIFYQLFKKENLFFITLTFICATIAARSSLIICFLLILVFLIKDIKIKYLFIFTTSSIALVIILLYNEDYLSSEFKYAIEPILIIFSKLESSGSFNQLINNHLYIPNFKTILIGDGYYHTSSGAFYGSTDSGYLRPLLFGGVIYLAYTVMVLIFISILSYGKNLNSIFYLIVLLTLNIKAEIFNGSIHFWLMCLIAFTENNIRKNLSSNENQI